VQASQPPLLLDLREPAGHVGVVGLAHHLLGHAEEDVVLLEDVLAQQRDILPGGLGKGAGVEGPFSKAAMPMATLYQQPSSLNWRKTVATGVLVR
jgi:hypothetical protein